MKQNCLVIAALFAIGFDTIANASLVQTNVNSLAGEDTDSL